MSSELVTCGSFLLSRSHFSCNGLIVNDEQGLDSLAHKQVLTEKSFGKVRMEAATRELSLRLKREITAGDIKTRALQHERLHDFLTVTNLVSRLWSLVLIFVQAVHHWFQHSCNSSPVLLKEPRG